MKINELKELLNGCDDDIEIWVSITGIANSWGEPEIVSVKLRDLYYAESTNRLYFDGRVPYAEGED